MRRTESLLTLLTLTVALAGCGDDGVSPLPPSMDRFRAEVAGARSGAWAGSAQIGYGDLEWGRVAGIALKGTFPGGEPRTLHLWFPARAVEAGSHTVVADWVPSVSLTAGDVAVSLSEGTSGTLPVTHLGRSGVVDLSTTPSEVYGTFEVTVAPGPEAEGEYSFDGSFRIER